MPREALRGESRPIRPARLNSRSAWVTNQYGDTRTGLNASTGALVQVLSSSNYGFAEANGISSDVTDVRVTNGSGWTLTAFPAS
jgi:hypothetical protein